MSQVDEEELVEALEAETVEQPAPEPEVEVRCEGIGSPIRGCPCSFCQRVYG